jgi:hypothetical protein
MALASKVYMKIFFTFIYLNMLAANASIIETINKLDQAEKRALSASESQQIEVMLQNSGTEVLELYSNKALNNIKTASINLVLGKRLIEVSQFAQAEQTLQGIPKHHRYYPESLLYRASIQILKKNMDIADQLLFECTVTANDMMRREKTKLSKRYYLIIEDQCNINRARNAFHQKKLDIALLHYDQIDKKSFLWPVTLYEKAWIYFHQKNYNKALGLIVTYRSPLLKSYFIPESELIQSLSYQELCLWTDANIVIDNYYSRYAPHSERILKTINNPVELKNVINAIKNWDLKHLDNFYRSMATQISKQLKYNFSINFRDKLISEIKETNNKQKKKTLENFLDSYERRINHMIYQYMINHINKVHFISKQLYYVKMDLLAEQREIAYLSPTRLNQRTRGSFEHVGLDSNQSFYTFNGTFWADELGDYSFGLKSNCR